LLRMSMLIMIFDKLYGLYNTKLMLKIEYKEAPISKCISWIMNSVIYIKQKNDE
jgi:hypothetical protein